MRSTIASAVVLGLAGGLMVLLGACGPTQKEQPDCDLSDPECLAQINATMEARRPAPPPPEKIAEVKRIFFSNEIIEKLVAGRQIGVAYWINVDYHSRPFYGQRAASVQIVFAEPVSFEGEVPTASDPCEGHYGEKEYVDPDDPCLDEPREYSTKQVTWSDVNAIYTYMEVDRGQVVDFYLAERMSPDILQEVIEIIERQTEQKE